MGLDFNLLLWRNAVEAAAAGVAVHDDDAQTVVSLVADALEALKGAFVDEGFELLGAAQKSLFLAACLADELVEVGLLLFQNVGLVVDGLLDVLDFVLKSLHLLGIVADVLLAEFYLEGLVLDFLGQVVEFVAVAHVVEL